MNFGNRRNRPMSNFGGFQDEGYPQDDFFDDGYGGYDDMGDNWQDNGPGGNRGSWGGFDGPWGPPPNFGPGGNMGPGGFAWGRGFGPSGPPIRTSGGPRNAVIRYLMSCGLPKDQLKRLPNDFLRLIQPDFCGLCNVILDNYNLSRSHYLSKLHFKNQKKWLNPQGPSMGYQRKQEPLKARDLYCELCDVHITSKSHADSHYSGKPHRAIVDGRKNAKNTILMQKHMSGRLDQLIRREKKHLKALPETEKVQEATVQEKPILPELYCEICKAPVTCSEQMTIHLNGKRHLAKEKRHILNMMQGKTEGNQKEDEEVNEGDEDMGEGGEDAEEDDAVDDGEETKNEGKADGGDQYDWGNGSGTWEDDK